MYIIVHLYHEYKKQCVQQVCWMEYQNIKLITVQDIYKKQYRKM